MNPLKPLPTEKLARKQMHKDVDALTRNPQARDRGLWDSENRRQHDALMKKRRDRIGAALTIIVVGFLLGVCLALQI